MDRFKRFLVKDWPAYYYLIIAAFVYCVFFFTVGVRWITPTLGVLVLIAGIYHGSRALRRWWQIDQLDYYTCEKKCGCYDVMKANRSK